MPKTIRNAYEIAVSFEELVKAHKKTRCGKREKKTIILSPIAITTILITTITTLVSVPRSNIKSDYIFYGIYTVRILDIKGSLFLLKSNFK